MSSTKYIGTGEITSADFKSVKWVGVSKSGAPVTIIINDAINLGNIDWTFAEKNDTVESIEMTGCYTNTDAASSDTTEPWSLEVGGSPVGAGNIVLGAGVFYVYEGGDYKAIALTRGGGKFVVEREIRQINADGDRGPVKGRIVMDASTPKLTINVLTILESLTSLHAGVAVSA